jgi:SAM-dependent methyltransferase
MKEPPLPPLELRRLVCHDDVLFDLPHPGTVVFPLVGESLYQSVFDFGCGCGRIARQLLAQDPKPKHYVGVDIHKGMIEWCQSNLSPYDSSFRFYHHDVWNLGLGPENTRRSTTPFPAGTCEFSLVIAHSIFTHLYKDQTKFYLGEIARILTENGVARTTWFLFDRATFPMLFDFQVSLFVNEVDPSNAVIYDWQWLLGELRRQGLRIIRTVPPSIRGHQWELYLQKSVEHFEHRFPLDPASQMMMNGSGTSHAAPPEIVAEVPPPLPEEAPEAVSDVQPDAEPAPLPPRHLLRFTGNLSAEEFQARCGELPWWYHSYYFDNGFSVRGDYDIGLDVRNYGFPQSMQGWRVLDIGTGAGWFAFYFEQLGAEVVTVDARGYCDFDVYGRGFNPPIEDENREPDRIAEDGTPLYYSPVSRGFWTMKDILQSKVRFRNARVYDINPALFGGEKFDLVFMGAILCHLRDPIGALMAARSVCKHRIIAATPVVLGETEAEVLPRQYLPYTKEDNISWWLPNEACFRHWFLAAGFLGVDVSRHINLRGDILRKENGRFSNGDQILRVGSAFVP